MKRDLKGQITNLNFCVKFHSSLSTAGQEIRFLFEFRAEVLKQESPKSNQLFLLQMKTFH